MSRHFARPWVADTWPLNDYSAALSRGNASASWIDPNGVINSTILRARTDKCTLGDAATEEEVTPLYSTSYAPQDGLVAIIKRLTSSPDLVNVSTLPQLFNCINKKGFANLQGTNYLRIELNDGFYIDIVKNEGMFDASVRSRVYAAIESGRWRPKTPNKALNSMSGAPRTVPDSH